MHILQNRQEYGTIEKSDFNYYLSVFIYVFM